METTISQQLDSILERGLRLPPRAQRALARRLREVRQGMERARTQAAVDRYLDRERRRDFKPDEYIVTERTTTGCDERANGYHPDEDGWGRNAR